MLKYCSEDGAQKPVSFQASKPDFFHGSRTEIRRFHWVCWWEEISSECPQSCQMVRITLNYFSALFSKKISPRCSHPQATLNKWQCIWHSLCRKSMTDCLLLLLWHWQWLFSFKAGALPVMNGKSDCRVWSLLRADSSYHLIIWGNFLKGLSLVKQDVFLSGTLQWLLMAKKRKSQETCNSLCVIQSTETIRCLKWLSWTCSTFLQISAFLSSRFCVHANRLRQTRLLGEVKLDHISARRACQTDRGHGL